MSTYIEVKNVSKTIRRKKILNQINISFQQGKVYGFKGHNGSGKTMLFRSICGLIIPTTGEILIENKEIGKDISFPPSVGVLIEYPGFLPQYTGFKNLQMLASIKRQIDDEQIKNVLERVGLSFDDSRKFKKYSLGMKQRLGLAQAIMEDPDLIILDEPTNALDQEGIQLVKNIVNELKGQSKTILIASHDYEFLNDVTDEIFTLNDGCIVGHEIND
ncbi:ATP-binding cassette domain-containing protein [Bacillus thuringiensis]|uniref:ATP-binding cassette domain-containing protein n=1 Tax=Bacillus thuringiensis TaxID=1428 RepID=UPI000EA2DF2B|nr:ATP-binding cassette domain-containing protein [Bacillus thuringiensis]RKI19405.1 ATP-binding cassette domain-containing protein [Bacillus thuringiensis]